MATFDAQISTWTSDDVLHFARRAGFGLRPEAAATLAGQSPASVVAAWVDGTQDETTLLNAFAYGDVEDNPGYGNRPDEWAPHPFHVRHEYGWLHTGQASWAWRMQYSPNPFVEKLALFWHGFFACGIKKVDNIALMLKQIQLFRTMGRGNFGDLLVAVSQDPAMMIWLDTVDNVVAEAGDVANENYAREIMELYSLGIDNGYNQQDIKALAKCFSGWTYFHTDLADPQSDWAHNDGIFVICRGQANPHPELLTFQGYTNLPDNHAHGSVSLFGQTVDLGSASGYGVNAIRLILTARGANCAEFLAGRFLKHFVDPNPTATAIRDLRDLILAHNFDLAPVFKQLFGSQYFYDASHRWSLIQGPVAWFLRAARNLCVDFTTANAPRVANPSSGMPRFSCWSTFANWDASRFSNMGQSILDPGGPNGWKEHDRWMSSDAYRHRTRAAYALCMKESRGEDHAGVERFLFESDVSDWFSTPPLTARAVFDRLAALIQPAPVPAAVRDAWLQLIWPASFTWDASAATQDKVRRLAFLILCSPQAQLC